MLSRRTFRTRDFGSAFSKEQKRILAIASSSNWITERDLKIIADPRFTPSQMREVMRACQELTDDQVAQIADPKISSGEMHSFRIENRRFERH